MPGQSAVPAPDAGPALEQMPLWREARKQASVLDESIYLAVASVETPTLDRTLARLSNAANYSSLWIVVGAVLAFVGGRRGRRAARDGIAAIGVASAVANLVLKRMADRARPDREVAMVHERRRVRMPHSTSFPSGHSASAFAFATGVSARIPLLGPLLYTLAGLVAYSRVHTGVHFPGDVVAGSLTGAMSGHLVAWTSRRFQGE